MQLQTYSASDFQIFNIKIMVLHKKLHVFLHTTSMKSNGPQKSKVSDDKFIKIRDIE